MLSTMKEVENFGLSFDVVDDLTGKKLGRASSGTFRTADVVGLDTMAHVVKTLQDNLSLETDPFYGSFGTPPVLAKLIELGNLGQKTKKGFYKKVGRDIFQFELDSEDYIPAGGKADEVYGRMLKKPAAERLKLLRNAEGKEGQFLWAILRNSFHYAAVHLQSIADCARDVDQAMRWGFGMKQGPFELWQEAGWLEVAKMVQEDIDAGKALCKAPLPNGSSKVRWPRPAACTPAMARGALRRTSSCRAVCCPCTSASCSPKSCWVKPICPTGRRLARRLPKPGRCAPGRWTARS
jgi:3-hydroxyacyl-CoA dehydrogenase